MYLGKLYKYILIIILIPSLSFAADPKAKYIRVDDVGSFYTSTNVEDVLQEVGSKTYQLSDLTDVNGTTQGAGRILISDGANFNSGVYSDISGLQSALDSKFNVDASNDPLTGSLEVNNDVTIYQDSYSYISTASPFSRSGTEYYSAGDVSVVYVISSGGSLTGMNNVTIFSDDGINASQTINSLSEDNGDLDVYLIDAGGSGGGVYITVVTDVSWADLKAFIDTLFGADLYNYSGTEGVGAYTITDNVYSFVMPSGWSVAVSPTGAGTTWTNPPDINGTPLTGFTYDFADASLDISGDLSNQNTDAIWWTKGVFSLGVNQENPVLPKEQMGMNVQPYFVSTNAITNVGAGMSPILGTSTDSDSSLYGLFGSILLSDVGDPPAGVNFTGNYTALNFTNFHNTTGNVSVMAGIYLGLSAQQDGSLDSYKGISFNIYTGGGTSSLTDLIYYDVPQINNGWTTTNAYGIKIDDNTSKATTSWGIYNSDRTYLGGNVGIGTTAPATKLDVNGEVTLQDVNTGTNAGTQLCIGANNTICLCNSCN